MSNTPETDAYRKLSWHSQSDWAEFVRKLERERDEYRAELERLRDVVCAEDVQSINRVLGDVA